MTRIVLGRDAEITEWVSSKLRVSAEEEFGPCRAIGMEIDGRIIGGVVYSHYQPDFSSIHMTIAAVDAKWANRGVIRALLSYPFITLCCDRITCLARKKNRRSRRLAEGIGFRVEGNIRRGFGTDDMIIYGLLREEAGRWLNAINEVKK